jgi:hypothetical protein
VASIAHAKIEIPSNYVQQNQHDSFLMFGNGQQSLISHCYFDRNYEYGRCYLDIEIDKTNKKITVLDYKTGSIPLGQNGKFSRSTAKIHKYEQQLYFYKILIENFYRQKISSNICIFNSSSVIGFYFKLAIFGVLFEFIFIVSTFFLATRKNAGNGCFSTSIPAIDQIKSFEIRKLCFPSKIMKYAEILEF